MEMPRLSSSRALGELIIGVLRCRKKYAYHWLSPCTSGASGGDVGPLAWLGVLTSKGLLKLPHPGFE